MELDLDYVMDLVAQDANLGICHACGAERDGCEPDAREYECYECGAFEVYGAEETLIMTPNPNWAG